MHTHARGCKGEGAYVQGEDRLCSSTKAGKHPCTDFNGIWSDYTNLFAPTIYRNLSLISLGSGLIASFDFNL